MTTGIADCRSHDQVGKSGHGSGIASDRTAQAMRTCGRLLSGAARAAGVECPGVERRIEILQRFQRVLFDRKTEIAR